MVVLTEGGGGEGSVLKQHSKKGRKCKCMAPDPPCQLILRKRGGVATEEVEVETKKHKVEGGKRRMGQKL